MPPQVSPPGDIKKIIMVEIIMVSALGLKITDSR